jgi:hypothetical protein
MEGAGGEALEVSDVLRHILGPHQGLFQGKVQKAEGEGDQDHLLQLVLLTARKRDWKKDWSEGSEGLEKK